MTNFIYEVRFPNNPDPNFTQKFNYKNEALNFAEQYPDAEVYMLELDYDDYLGTRGTGYLVQEIQVKGPEVDDAVEAGIESGENSCACDNPDNYTNGEFRAPKLDDDLDSDEELVDEDNDDITDAELGEALFSAIDNKKHEAHDEKQIRVYTDSSVLNEDSAGVVDDSDIAKGESNCNWCGEKFKLNQLHFKKDIGYVCADCLDIINKDAD